MYRTVKSLRLGIVTLLIGVVTVASADPPCFRGLGDLPGGGVHSQAIAISADGMVVVGMSSSSNPEAFRWTGAGGMVGLGYTDDWNIHASDAAGVSADGSVVVGTSMSGPGIQAYRWDAVNGMVSIGDIPGGAAESEATDVSADGTVIVGKGRSELYSDEAARWTAESGMIGLGVLPGDSASFARNISADGQTVIGFSSGSLYRAFVWTQPTGMYEIFGLPGGDSSAVPHDISSDGSFIVGESSSINSDPGYPEATLWIDEIPVGLGDLPGGRFFSVAHGISADGSVIVGRGTTGPSEDSARAFIWDAARGMRNLGFVLDDEFDLAMDGWTLIIAFDVSGDGKMIVGAGMNPEGYEEGWIARVPPEGGTCPGDLDLDGDIDLADLALLLAAYGQDTRGDCDCDNRTGLSDLALLLAYYGSTCR